VFEEIKNKSTGMKGFMVMDDLQDIQESVVLTFWEKKKIWILFINQKTSSYLI
jgi:heme-degrading monooxygenase HmoA